MALWNEGPVERLYSDVWNVAAGVAVGVGAGLGVGVGVGAGVGVGVGTGVLTGEPPPLLHAASQDRLASMAIAAP